MTLSNRLGFVCVFIAVAAVCCGIAHQASALGVIYDENFTGLVTNNLNGSTPDVDNNGGTNTWLAYSGFKQNGLIATANVSQGAWLPFAPQAGNNYTLSVSFTGVGPDGSSNSWLAMGFAKALPTAAQAESGQNRFIETPTLGRAWMLYRANNPSGSNNMIHLGNNSTGTATGPQSPAAWTDTSLSEGGDIDMQIVLDTNPAIWTATFFAKRPADSLYTQVSSGALNLLTQDIAGVGFARTTGSISGMITNFTLESTAPILVPGDVNGDGHVDDLDFNIIRDHLFTSGNRGNGDLTNDNYVDFSDFRQWKTAHEAGSFSASNFELAAPEPASAILALIAVASSLFVGRRRRDIAPRQNH